jgi:TP901 family phage tail tape measure protein
VNQNLIVRLAAQGVGAFKASMASAAASVKDLHDTSRAAAGASEAATRKAGMAMAAVGVAVVAAAAASAAAAIQLETRMQNVATIWTDASVSIEQAGNRVIDMSRDLPVSANNLAEGLYDVASSGFQGAEGLEVLQASARAASAGLTSTATAAKGITAVLNAYGLSADSAATVSDVLFQTVNLGVVTFEELANTMGDFVGTAAVAGVNIRDANTALATLTLNGISAAEAGTSMNRMLQALIQPGEELTAVLRGMGFASGLAALEQLGLQGTMQGLVAATGGGAVAMSGLFTEIRGLRGALALTSAEGANYARVAEVMNDESQLLGATQRALDEQAKSTSFQFSLLKNSVVAAAIQFGQALLPAIKMVVGAFQGAVDVFSAIPGPLRVILGVGVLIAGMLVGIAGAFLLLSPAIVASSVAWNVLTASIARATAASLTFIATPVGAALAVVGAAVAVVTGLWASHAKGQADTKRRVDDLKESLDAETGAITDQTAEILRNRVVSDDLDKAAKKLGVSLETLMLAMTGDKAALEEVNAVGEQSVQRLYDEYAAAIHAAGAYGQHSQAVTDAREAWQDAQGAQDKLSGGIKKSTGDLEKAVKASKRDQEAKTAAVSVTDQLTRATTAEAEANRLAAEAAQAHRVQMEGLAKALSAAFSPTAAFSAADDAFEDSQTTQTSTLNRELDARYEAQQEANDKAFKLEKDNLERITEERSRALEEEHQRNADALDLRFRQEEEALDREHQVRKNALDVEHQVRKNALDDDHRARKQALDDVFRLERRQLDRRLDLLDEEWDKRRRAEDKAYEAQKSEAEFMIRTTWGAERQGWIDRLGIIEEGHEAATREMDRGQEDEANALEDGQADSEEVRKNGLADQLRAEEQGLAAILGAEKEGLALILAAEKQHLADVQAAIDQAETDRFDSAKTALAEWNKLESDALDERIRVTGKKLDDLKALEDTKADERRTSAKTKRDLTLADALTALDANNLAQEAKLDNLRTIWERAGRNLSTAMLEELGKLEPQVLAELADTGDQSFDRFMGAFEASVTGVTPARMAEILAPFSGKTKELLDQVGRLGGMDLMANIAKGLSDDPAGQEKLRNAILSLWTSPQGVLVNPQTGLRAALNAEGSIAGRQATTARRPILWAEAGLEAYIPMDMAKARRSVGLLGEVADFYGYGLMRLANGGIVGGQQHSSGGTSGPSYSITIGPISVAAGVDPNAVGVAVRREVERAFDHLGRQVAVRAWRN